MLQKKGLLEPSRQAQTKTILAATLTFLILLFAMAGAGANSEKRVSEEQITGIGYGTSPELAKKMALAQVVYKINRKITYNRCQSNTGKSSAFACSSLAYHFDLPLKGVRYKDLAAGPGQYGQQASLSRAAIADQFKDQLPQLRAKVTTAISTDIQSPERLQDLWQAHDAYVAYSELLTLFGLETGPSLSKEQLQTLNKMEMAAATTIHDLDQLADPIVELGEVQNAFIHAPVPEGSVEMTPFSERIRRLLSQQLAKRFPEADIKLRGQASRGLVRYQQCHDPVRNLEKNCATPDSLSKGSSPDHSDKLLLGEYRQDGDAVVLRYKLLDINTGKARTALIRVPNRLVSGTRTAPIHQAFDQELYKNIVGDDEFHVRLGSSRGDRNLLLYEQEPITLKWRASQPAYFYIVGHVIHKTQQYSYLVELDSANGTFVGRIGPEQANRWVEIGQFTVYPPLGVEHIQLVAATYDLQDRLPPTRLDQKLGYHVIRGSEDDAMAGLKTVRGLQRVCSSATTRGLQRVCSGRTKIEVASTQAEQSDDRLYEHESVLSYTSLPRASADPE